MRRRHGAAAPSPPPDELLAESLRARGWGIAPDFVAADAWRALALEARERYARGAFRHAGVGRGASFRVAPDIRNDEVLWIDPGAPGAASGAGPALHSRAQRHWLERVERLRLALNRRLLLGLFAYEGHLARYAPGARYQTHLDRFADASHRLVSLVLYLNEDWQAGDGGALRLHLGGAGPTPWHDVEPRGGTVVAFLSGELFHEVLPAARERWSLVGWLTARR